MISISRIVSVTDGILNIKGNSISQWEVQKFFGKIPSEDYRITYELNCGGPFIVFKGEKIMQVKRINKSPLLGFLEECGVCFLPEDWEGRRVIRKTKLLRRSY